MEGTELMLNGYAVIYRGHLYSKIMNLYINDSEYRSLNDDVVEIGESISETTKTQAENK